MRLFFRHNAPTFQRLVNFKIRNTTLTSTICVVLFQNQNKKLTTITIVIVFKIGGESSEDRGRIVRGELSRGRIVWHSCACSSTFSLRSRGNARLKWLRTLCENVAFLDNTAVQKIVTWMVLKLVSSNEEVSPWSDAFFTSEWQRLQDLWVHVTCESLSELVNNQGRYFRILNPFEPTEM